MVPPDGWHEPAFVPSHHCSCLSFRLGLILPVFLSFYFLNTFHPPNFTSSSFPPLFHVPMFLVLSIFPLPFSTVDSLKWPNLGSMLSLLLSTLAPWASEWCWRNVHDLSRALSWDQHSLNELSDLPTNHSPPPSCPLQSPCFPSLRRWPWSPGRETWSHCHELSSLNLLSFLRKISYIFICLYLLWPRCDLSAVPNIWSSIFSTLYFLSSLEFLPCTQYYGQVSSIIKNLPFLNPDISICLLLYFSPLTFPLKWNIYKYFLIKYLIFTEMFKK